MNIHSIFFSPTGTSAKIVCAITDGIGECVEQHDLTFRQIEPTEFTADDLLLVAGPVYGGHIAPIFKQRLEGIRGVGARCIVIAVYGNRAFEKALADLASFLTDRGFTTVGVAAFVGEHSYSTVATPIASGRPDAEDLKVAADFGHEIAARLAVGTLAPVDVAQLTDEPSPATSIANFISFVKEYQRQQAEAPRRYVPEVDASLCDGCGTCYAACPTAAIEAGRDVVDPERCIKCAACVKVCPTGARTLYTPFARPLSENFNHRKSPRFLI